MRNRIAIVDISTRKFKALSYKQYDVNNILQIVVMENNKIVDISSYNATIYFKLPSEKTYRTIGIIKNNTINVTLSSGVLKEYGKVILEVKLSNGDEIVTTFSIYLNVEKSIDSTDSSDADDDPNLEDIYHTHNNKDILDQITQEMIDSILAGGGLVDLSIYQTKRDTNLDTTDKTIIGAINELNEKIENGSIGGGSCTCDKHTHDNKVILDGITQTKINEWDSAEENVQVDWNETDTTSDTYIKNKPDLTTYATRTYVTEEIAKASTGGTVDLSNYQTKSDNVLATTDKTVVGAINELKTDIDNIDVPTKTSDLTNDSGFLTDIPSEYITETELDAKNYIDETELNAKGYAIKTEVDTALSDKVDIEAGKGLSANDFTDDLKTKLEGIEEGAEVNVQSDWNITDTSNDTYIKNKPDLTTYATKSFVSDEIAKVVTGGTVDLSGYAKLEDTGNKANLTTIEKTNLVNAINELDNEIGDLDDLTTDDKTDLVTAINEHDIEIGKKRYYKISTDANALEVVADDADPFDETTQIRLTKANINGGNFAIGNKVVLIESTGIHHDIDILEDTCIRMGADIDDSVLDIDSNVLNRISALETDTHTHTAMTTAEIDTIMGEIFI